MNIVLISTICLIGFVNSAACQAADAGLVFSTTLKKHTLSFRLSTMLLDRISQQIKTPITLKYLPAKRSALLFGLGKIDAEFSRVAQYKKLQPNSIIVEEPLSSVPIYVYSIGKNFTVKGWESLMPYRILTVNGWVYTKENLANHDTVEVESPLQAFKLLKAGRADFFATGLITATGVFNTKGFEKAGIIRLEPSVHMINTFTFFLPKHQLIAKAYGDALKRFKEDGTYNKILNSKPKL